MKFLYMNDIFNIIDHICVTLVGEIVEAIGFEGDNLFMNWEFHLPEHWHVDNTELLEFD